jgi:hypothetical protein
MLFFQTCAILISSFIFTQLLTVKLLKALRSKRMKWFLIQSILIIFSLSILFSLIFTYIRVDRSAPLPPNFVKISLISTSGCRCAFLYSCPLGCKNRIQIHCGTKIKSNFKEKEFLIRKISPYHLL